LAIDQKENDDFIDAIDEKDYHKEGIKDVLVLVMKCKLVSILESQQYATVALLMPEFAHDDLKALSNGKKLGVFDKWVSTMMKHLHEHSKAINSFYGRDENNNLVCANRHHSRDVIRILNAVSTMFI
jgi:hypothetical protein